MSAETVLSARGLVVRYGAVEAVHGIDLEIGRGEVVGLIGPDGAGKTSTLRVLAGLLRSSAGVELAFGSPLWKSRRALHHRLGYLAQRFALYGDLSVDENVQLFARLFGVPGWQARRDDLLQRVELARFRDRRAENLSGGMKQKLALACTLIHSPELLLLDEPTTGVDPVTRRELWRLLAGFVAEGLTLVVATPYLDEAERCSHVGYIDQSRLLVAGRTPEVKALPEVTPPGLRRVEVACPQAALALGALRNVPQVHDATLFGEALHLLIEETFTEQELVAALGWPAEAVSIRTIPPSLEDVFVTLSRREAARRRA